MKKFICDICGISVSEYKLTTLYEDIQPENIEHVCDDCYKIIANAKLKIEAAFKPIKQSWIKKIILKLKNDARKPL